MLEFCPECSNLLRKRNINGVNYLACGCGYKKKLDEQPSSAGGGGINAPRRRVSRASKPTKAKNVDWDPPDALMVYSKLKDAPWKKNAGASSEPSARALTMIKERLDSRYYNCGKCKKFTQSNSFCRLHERTMDKESICKSFTPIHAGFGAKKVKRKNPAKKKSSASKKTRRCSYCIFYMDGYCHAHKKKVPASGAACDKYEYIYERSEEMLRKK